MALKYGTFILFLLCLALVLQADEPAVFTPPQAYPVARYEAGWSKNPFTLKTVAPVAEQGLFARDLAIGAHYGAADNPTVVVVNTKTNERILLRKDQPGPGGMSLKEAHLSSNRRECQVEVMQGTQAAVLTYNSNYLGQLAANEASRMATSKPGAAPAGKAVQLPPMPVKPSAPNTVKVSQVAPPVPVAPPPAVMGASSAVPPRFRGVVPTLPLPPSQTNR